MDANQGVQAQTVANYHLANGQGLVVLPVLNKIDLANANPDQVKDQLFNLFTIDPDDVLMVNSLFCLEYILHIILYLYKNMLL